jgi:hypothetical protein
MNPLNIASRPFDDAELDELNGAEDRIVESPATPEDGIEPPRPFPTVRVLEGEPPAPPTMDIHQFLVNRDINTLSAQGGSGKGVVLLLSALSTATGLPLFGSLVVNRVGPVDLVMPEDGFRVARMRLDAMIDGLGLTDTNRTIACERIRMVAEDAIVDITRDTPRLRQTALDHEAVSYVIDPLGQVLGGQPDNDNVVADRVCGAIRRDLCHGAGATVALSTHIRKPGKEANGDTGPSQHDTRGGGGWVNGSRLVWALSAKGTRLTLTATKSNGLPSGLRHELELHIITDESNPALWRECRVTDTNAGANHGAASQALTPGVGRSINENERKALIALDDRHEPGRRVSWSEWKGTSGLVENTLKSVKDRLLGASLAQALPAGKHRNGGNLYNYSITPDGRSALENGWVNHA